PNCLAKFNTPDNGRPVAKTSLIPFCTATRNILCVSGKIVLLLDNKVPSKSTAINLIAILTPRILKITSSINYTKSRDLTHDFLLIDYSIRILLTHFLFDQDRKST